MTGYTIWLAAAGAVPAAPVRDCRPFSTREAASIHSNWLSWRLARLSTCAVQLEVRSEGERA